MSAMFRGCPNQTGMSAVWHQGPANRPAKCLSQRQARSINRVGLQMTADLTTRILNAMSCSPAATT